MADLKYVLFGFDGRISRKSWWLGTIILSVASIVGTLLADPSVFDLGRPPPRTPNWPATIWTLALVIPGTALMVKRFNDRDWPYWLGFAFGALGATINLGRHFGWFYPESGNVLESIAIVLLVFPFIDNGFLRGTNGPNHYGPDPLTVREIVQ